MAWWRYECVGHRSWSSVARDRRISIRARSALERSLGSDQNAIQSATAVSNAGVPILKPAKESETEAKT